MIGKQEEELSLYAKVKGCYIPVLQQLDDQAFLDKWASLDFSCLSTSISARFFPCSHSCELHNSILPKAFKGENIRWRVQ